MFVEWTVFRNGSIFGGEKVKGDTEKGKIASLNGRALKVHVLPFSKKLGLRIFFLWKTTILEFRVLSLDLKIAAKQ